MMASEHLRKAADQTSDGADDPQVSLRKFEKICNAAADVPKRAQMVVQFIENDLCNVNERMNDLQSIS